MSDTAIARTSNAKTLYYLNRLHMDTSDLHQLPVDAKIKIVFDLWDEIAASGEPIALPPGVIAEIERRCAEVAADPNITIDEDEMWRRVDE